MLNRQRLKIQVGVLVLTLVSSILLIAASCSSTPQPNGPPPAEHGKLTRLLDAAKAERQKSYAAVRKLQYLQDKNLLPDPITKPYYNNGEAYYTNYVEANFNSWLSQLETEVSQNQTLIDTPTDIQQEAVAISYNDVFSNWVQAVYNSFSNGTGLAAGSHQGGYVSVRIQADEPTPFLEKALDTLKEKVEEESLKQFLETVWQGVGQIDAENQIQSAHWADWISVILT